MKADKVAVLRCGPTTASSFYVQQASIYHYLLTHSLTHSLTWIDKSYFFYQCLDQVVCVTLTVIVPLWFQY
jgi:hypothetical protein